MGLYELQICCIFLQSNYPEYPGIGKDFPRMTFGEFPGKFPIGKSPGNITNQTHAKHTVYDTPSIDQVILEKDYVQKLIRLERHVS